jgi:hypothetical protein
MPPPVLPDPDVRPLARIVGEIIIAMTQGRAEIGDMKRLEVRISGNCAKFAPAMTENNGRERGKHPLEPASPGKDHRTKKTINS